MAPQESPTVVLHVSAMPDGHGVLVPDPPQVRGNADFATLACDTVEGQNSSKNIISPPVPFSCLFVPNVLFFTSAMGCLPRSVTRLSSLHALLPLLLSSHHPTWSASEFLPPSEDK